MRGCFVLVCAVLMTGCQAIKSLPDREVAWHALHAIDVAQTLNAAQDPCYIEAYPITQSLIGEQPSNAEVFAWGVGTAAGHYLVSRSLEHFNVPQWVQKVWGYTTVGHTTYTIASNHRNGVRMFGDNSDVAGCF